MAETSAGDRAALSDLVCRFQQAYDEHDWPGLRSCIAEEMNLDSSSVSGRPPEVLGADDFVARQRKEIEHLVVQHNHLNLRLAVDGDRAGARCNYVVFRFEPEGPGHFHSWGVYRLGFTRTDAGWRISALREDRVRDEGDPGLLGRA